MVWPSLDGQREAPGHVTLPVWPQLRAQLHDPNPNPSEPKAVDDHSLPPLTTFSNNPHLHIILYPLMYLQRSGYYLLIFLSLM